MTDKNFDKRELLTEEELDNVLGGFRVPIVPNFIKSDVLVKQFDDNNFRSVNQIQIRSTKEFNLKN